MSTRTQTQNDGLNQARALDISDLPVSQIRGYAANVGDVYFERRGGRTFLVAGK